MPHTTVNPVIAAASIVAELKPLVRCQCEHVRVLYIVCPTWRMNACACACM